MTLKTTGSHLMAPVCDFLPLRDEFR